MIQIEENNHVYAYAYQMQKEGKTLCGDSFLIKSTEDYFICAVADGLGSGERAYESSSAIKEVVEELHAEDVGLMIEKSNEVLKNKRGATVAIFKAYFKQNQFTFSSVGNIRFVLYSPSGTFVYPLPVLGYMSGKPQKFRVQSFAYDPGAKFIIHSDGLNIPAVKSLLKDNRTIEDISNQLEPYTISRQDDLTYVVGQLF
ncbi:SpoIIE family protein phosphatase [Metabacillus idriensis]|uniref:SpoIIE family protein phosphatase n=1 Tax=Metabacillus idriensis TaxID=324768 RepID=A0A6I2ML31_9BACI|nr:PP2C family serine/threonine-protein phosphatase [Metabacillus idriensis]MCM3598767.1 SpoIIE family protein phosphatase [Metabacillus idriensis]MRX56563.1 SpoIIE family protein phosphatase [Metabacillus idriensis]OHR73457.1 phosphoserine phosphatase [Bacillus sp. HMSC76G11]